MKKLLFALTIFGFTGVANAGVILQAESATTNMGTWSSEYNIEGAIDQSGLSSNYVSGVTDFDAFLASVPTEVASSDTWFSSRGVSSGNFDLYLGNLFTIESMAFWNESQGIGQGVNRFNLYADIASDFSTATLLGNFNAVEGISAAQVFEFSPISASYVRLEVLSNQGASCCTGIMEIAFESGARQVPEPATFALFGIGLAGLGFARKKRKSA